MEEILMIGYDMEILATRRVNMEPTEEKMKAYIGCEELDSIHVRIKHKDYKIIYDKEMMKKEGAFPTAIKIWKAGEKQEPVIYGSFLVTNIDGSAFDIFDVDAVATSVAAIRHPNADCKILKTAYMALVVGEEGVDYAAIQTRDPEEIDLGIYQKYAGALNG